MSELEVYIQQVVNIYLPKFQTQPVWRIPELVSFIPNFDVFHQDTHIRLYQQLFVMHAALRQLHGLAVNSTTQLSLDVGLIEITSSRLPITLGRDHKSAPAIKSAGYFDDPETFYSLTARDIQRLIEQFWSHSVEKEDVVRALGILDVSESDNWQVIQKAYRMMVQIHHPDKGGKRARFDEIRQAYTTLKRFFGKK